MADNTLIVGPSWVGDMVMAQSLFKAIKDNYPSTTIEVLAPEWSRPLTERMPEVAHSIGFPLKHGELNLKTRYNFGKQLQKRGYQRCFVLPNSFKSALVPFFAKIPKRIGWRGEWRYGLLNETHILNKKDYPLMVERYIALAFNKNRSIHKTLFQPKLLVKEENVQAALIRYQLDLSKPLLALCPGAEFGPSKRWPEKYYAIVANYFLAKGWQIWIFGSAKDGEVAKNIQTQIKNQGVDLTGRTSLADAIDLMSKANLVVSNDSGLMHIAAALDCPLVAVYGSTDPGYTPPLNEKAIIVRENLTCSPCFQRTCPLEHHACMEKLIPKRVIDAAEALFNL